VTFKSWYIPLSFSHLYVVFIYCWTCYRSEYIWFITHWTLSNNQSSFYSLWVHSITPYIVVPARYTMRFACLYSYFSSTKETCCWACVCRYVGFSHDILCPQIFVVGRHQECFQLSLIYRKLAWKGIYLSHRFTQCFTRLYFYYFRVGRRQWR